MNDKIISLIGLGAVGAPLADLLFKRYGNKFKLLSSKEFVHTLNDLFINDEEFNPEIITCKKELKQKIEVVFVCVKNYQIEGVADTLKELIDEETIIFPLQNGVYSYEFFKNEFPKNIILEGFVQGPNTKIVNRAYTYQKPGVVHIGTSNESWKNYAKDVFEVLKNAKVNVFYDEKIKVDVWKKLMLNVAGNAITALTDLDYCMFVNSPEAQNLCRKVMKEFKKVAISQGIVITDDDIDNVISYYKSFKVSKRTSMLEDVLNKRKTENEYLAGYISKLSMNLGIKTPNIDMLYYLVKIKESVYMGKL